MHFVYSFQMSPTPDPCPERQRLIGELKAVNHELNEIHQAEIAAVIDGRLNEFDELQPRLERTREYRRVVVESLYEHLQQHGC